MHDQGSFRPGHRGRAPRRSRSRWLRTALLVGLLAGAGAIAGAAPAATPAQPTSIPFTPLLPPLVTVLTPGSDAVVTTPRVRVVVRVQGPVRSVRASVGVGRRSVRLRPIGGRRFAGVVGGLLPGRNTLDVRSVTAGGSPGAAITAVTYALRRHGLLQLRAPRRTASPVTVSARVPRNEIGFRAWLNGRRIDSRFSAAVRGVRSASLSASDFVRYGRNRLVVQVVADTQLRNDAGYDTAATTFFVPRDRPLVGAGVDSGVTTNARAWLNGEASPPHAPAGGLLGAPRPRYRWVIIQRPPGSRARLRNPAAARPSLIPDKPGTYRIRMVARMSPGPRTVAATASASSAADVVTLTAQDSFPLFGLKASVPNANGTCYGITIGPEQDGVDPDFHQNPACGGGRVGIHVLTLARDTLQPQDEKSFSDGSALLTYLNGLSAQSSAGLLLVVINLDPAYIAADGSTIFTDPSFNKAIRTIGGWGYPSAPVTATSGGGALIVGVPGWQPGSGYQSANPAFPSPDALTGFLAQDNQTVSTNHLHTYRFLPRSGQFQYKTAYGGGGGAGTMQIAGGQYATTPATDAGRTVYWSPSDPYVHVVVVRADAPTLGPPPANAVIDRAFAVDSGPSELERLGSTLEQFVGDRSALVFMQTVGDVFRPGYGFPSWYAVGDLLGKLGGSAWVWDSMPTAPNAAGNQNSYALVGGQAIVDEGRAEPVELGGVVPDPWTGGPGPKFAQGVLARNNVGWLTPQFALPGDPTPAPGSNVGQTLSQIVYQAPQAWPQMNTPGEQAAYTWINSQHARLNFACNNTDLPGGSCDVRYLYRAGTANDDWSSTITDLKDLPFDSGQAAGNFTAADLSAVKTQLITEMNNVDNVNTWFRDMRAPLVDNQGQINADIGAEAQNTINSIPMPKTSAALKWTFFAANAVLGLVGSVDDSEPLVVAGEAVAGAADLATESDGQPITGQIQTTSSQLGVTVTRNIQTSLDTMEQMREIVLSDWGKLNAVGTLTEKGGAWHATAGGYTLTQEQMEVGAIRETYQALLPAIGKVFQVWPAMAWSLNNRSLGDIVNFRCKAPLVPEDGKPFAYQIEGSGPTHHSQPASAQVKLNLWPENYYGTNAQAAPPWSFLAYRLSTVKWYEGQAPTASLTDNLAKPPAPDGVFTIDPGTKLPNPGFYMPWFLGRAFQPIQFDCSNYNKNG